MAFSAPKLRLMSGVPGYAKYRYDTTDALTTVDGSGYFDNEDNATNLAVGDVIEVVVWGTAVGTGTIAGYGVVIINSVSGGVIDATNDFIAGTLADSD